MNSMKLFNEIAHAAKKVRDDTETIDVDIALSDGTVLRRKGDGAATLEELDEIIEVANAQAAIYQACAVAVDPIYPSYCCESPSCDR